MRVNQRSRSACMANALHCFERAHFDAWSDMWCWAWLLNWAVLGQAGEDIRREREE